MTLCWSWGNTLVIRMLYGTTIMQTLSKVYRALPHAVYTFRVYELYRVYIVSFNRVIDIQYFIALSLMRFTRAVNLGQSLLSVFRSHSRHYAICNVSERPISLRVFTQGEWGRSLCKCFLGKFRLAKTGG